MREENFSTKTFIEAVILFSQPISDNFGRVINYETKEDNTPVTSIDKQINSLFMNWVKKFPNLGFIGEEGNGTFNQKYILLVDPLDGTEVFMRGIATSTTIMTLMRMDNQGTGTPIFSIIHNPITKEVWYARENAGAYKFLAGCATKKTLQTPKTSGCIRTAVYAWPGASHNLLMISKEIVNDTRFSDQQIGALGIGGALIAQGTLDVTACGTSSAVEVAAMSLIVREAGGTAMNLNGDPVKSFELGTWKGKKDFLLPDGAIIANNPESANTLLSFIQENQQ